MDKLDLKKQLKHLYLPSAKEVSFVDVPAMRFVSLEGQIEPNAMPGTSPGFARAIGALYGFAYTLKFMSRLRAEGPVDYTVMPLEGLWTTPAGGADYANEAGWMWTLMIMQPDHIDQDMFDLALTQLKEKRERDARKAANKGDGPSAGDAEDFEASLACLDWVRLESFHEGLCAQVMHIGPYADEARTLAKMGAVVEQNGYAFHGKHHEIYLGNPRTAKPENLKTVLRHPVHSAA